MVSAISRVHPGVPVMAQRGSYRRMRAAATLAGAVCGSSHLCHQASQVVRLELLHNERHPLLFRQIDEMLELLEEVRITSSTFRTAIDAIRDLAQLGAGGFHRVGLADALVAASAQERVVGVLHYNAKDFDKLAKVLVFESVPLGPPGSFERAV